MFATTQSCSRLAQLLQPPSLFLHCSHTIVPGLEVTQRVHLATVPNTATPFTLIFVPVYTSMVRFSGCRHRLLACIAVLS